MTKRDEHVSAMLVQKHQLDQSENKLSELDAALNALQQNQQSNNDAIDLALADLDMMLDNQGINSQLAEDLDITQELFELESSVVQSHAKLTTVPVALLDTLDFNENMDWAQYQQSVEQYALNNHVDLSADPFTTLMSPIQRIELEKRIKDEFTIKNAQCDKYDYLIAGTCGVLGGLIDVFFVGRPGEGVIGQKVDKGVKGAVVKFSETVGFNRSEKETDGYLKYIERCERKNKTPLEKDKWLEQQAVQFLEKKFGINYDQTSNNGKHSGTGGATENLSASNHHLKSLGHSPDLLGLFFSIYNQFTNTSTFIENGKLITINTKTFELEGENLIAKIFCGFVNWLGHLFSDMAGSNSSIAKGNRGSGIPIPFYNLLLTLDVGEFGQDKQTFATIATKVFEKGYDFRHGIAMAIPVLITDLLTRLMWSSKQRLYHKKPWVECIPSASNPELRRMLLVSHGALCLIDAGDAVLKSGGDMVQFLLRTNLIGWARFGTLALKEVYAWHNAGHIDVDAVDEYLDAELKILAT